MPRCRSFLTRPESAIAESLSGGWRMMSDLKPKPAGNAPVALRSSIIPDLALSLDLFGLRLEERPLARHPKGLRTMHTVSAVGTVNPVSTPGADGNAPGIAAVSAPNRRAARESAPARLANARGRHHSRLAFNIYFGDRFPRGNPFRYMFTLFSVETAPLPIAEGPPP
jgi:hypothetical protein